MKKFKRTIEDFKCENCEHEVKGNGYTNHCPKCLWSKHVDDNPGDRKNSCGGKMEPVEAFYEQDAWFVIHRCDKCEAKKKIKLNKEDSLLAVEDIIAKQLK